MTEKKLTGYPSIDKPWLKYYSDEAINAPLPECTMYEYLKEQNKEYLDNVALAYFDKEISYRELFEKIDKAAAAFKALGVSNGDVVTIQSTMLPQVVYMIYALSKIGAVANLIYVTSPAEEVEQNLAETNSKLYIVPDFVYGSLKMNLDSSIKVVIMTATDELMPQEGKSESNTGIIGWNEFMSFSNSQSCEISGKNEDVVIMVYTGGTTGKSKAVMLTNYAMNTAAVQYGALEFGRHEIFLCLLPPFIAFGLTVTLHVPLIYGTRSIICVSIDPTDISEFVEKYHPHNIVCGTAQAEKMIMSLSEKNIDLSNLKFIGVGGDALSASLENRINEFLSAHGSSAKIIQGYAMSEIAACGTGSVYRIHKKEKAGIPFVHNTIKIVDPDTNKEMSYNEAGEVCFNSPSVMTGYYHNEEETNDMLKWHDDGKLWVHTGDIGSLDEDGFITIVGRIKRMILTSESNVFHKVFPKIIEDKLIKTGYISAVSIVGKPSEARTNDLVAFIVTDSKDTQSVISALSEFSDTALESYERPIKYVVVDKLPLTTVGKVDYRALEKMA